MRRPVRILFHVAATLSLLLCLTAISSWWWTRTGMLGIERQRLGSFQFLSVSRGELQIMTYHTSSLTDPYHSGGLFGWEWARTDLSPDLLADATNLFPAAHPPVSGFFIGHLQDLADDTTLILIPMWFVTSLFAILPVAAGVRQARRRRRATRLPTGRRITCGHDLRAT